MLLINSKGRGKSTITSISINESFGFFKPFVETNAVLGCLANLPPLYFCYRHIHSVSSARGEWTYCLLRESAALYRIQSAISDLDSVSRHERSVRARRDRLFLPDGNGCENTVEYDKVFQRYHVRLPLLWVVLSSVILT